MNIYDLLNRTLVDQTPEELASLLNIAVVTIHRISCLNPTVPGGKVTAVFAASEIIEGAQQQLARIRKHLDLDYLLEFILRNPTIPDETSGSEINTMYN